MTIEFRCGACSKLLRTTDDKAGASAKCPQCGTSVTVPAASAPEELFDDDVIPPAVAEKPPLRGDSPWPFEEGAPPKRPSSSSAPKRACPMCGEQVAADDARCPHCGERLSARPRPVAQRDAGLRPHRGGMILAFGLLGWFVCPIFSLLAMIMGGDDLKEIAAGRMDPEGESMTQAGRIVGMIHCIIIALMVLGFCGLMLLGAAVGPQH